jgi:hypothetical protein
MSVVKSALAQTRVDLADVRPFQWQETDLAKGSLSRLRVKEIFFNTKTKGSRTQEYYRSRVTVIPRMLCQSLKMMNPIINLR